MQLPNGVAIIDFTDDIGVTILTSDIKEVNILTNKAIWKLRPWLEGIGQVVAKHKMEAILISKRWKQTLMNAKISEQTIHSQPALKYLGVIMSQAIS